VKEFTVSSLETGRLASVEVVPGQRVSRGQVVARLDVEILEGEIAVAGAELRELESQIPAEDKTLLLSALQTERAFQAELEEAEVELQAAHAASAQDRAELASLREELSRQRDLVARRLSEANRLRDIELRLAALEQSVAAWPARTEALGKRRQGAAERLSAWRASHAGTSGGNPRAIQLRPLELRIVRQHEYLRLLRKRLEKMVLRAPSDAHVATLVARQGNVLTPGDPVMIMVEAGPRQVIAYVEEDRGYALSVGQQAVIRRRDRAADRVEGTLTAIAGTVSQLPARFWPAPNRPRWGREVFITVGPGPNLDPGEAVDITFSATGGAFQAASPVVAVAKNTSGAPTPLVIPWTLRSKSRFEPSGLLWVEALQRYLIVSDDTGLESANDNAPWLFTLSRDGVVDPEPLPIQGVAAVNDLEGITTAPDGTIYLIASQSTNIQGRRRPPRTALIQARLSGKTLTATGHIFFHDLLTRAAQRDPTFLTSLGLPSKQGSDGPLLEIEGLAWHDRGLFLGLKEPLDPNGQALIWKVEDADRLFRGTSLSVAGLTLWRKVRLQAQGQPAGISELLFLSDGNLLLAARNDQGGAVFRAQFPAGGDLAVETLASFPALKPEGLSVAADRNSLVVVFDREEETPLWTQLVHSK
jgi:multidrug resistance efflux pump